MKHPAKSFPCLVHSSRFFQVRLGRDFDGGYVLPDDFLNISSAISIGIGNDQSFDYALAELGISVFQFDGTIENPPKIHEKIIFNKENWNEHGSGVCLRDMIDRIGNNKDLLLKFDVDGVEWPNIVSLDQDILKYFRIIVCELHGFLTNPSSVHHIMIESINKLTANHQLVHVHGNNYGLFSIFEGCPIADVIEVSLHRNDRGPFLKYAGELPTSLDRPNNKKEKDLVLRSY